MEALRPMLRRGEKRKGGREVKRRRRKEGRGRKEKERGGEKK